MGRQLDFDESCPIESISLGVRVSCVKCNARITNLLHKCDDLYKLVHTYNVRRRELKHKEIVEANCKAHSELIEFTAPRNGKIDFFNSLVNGYYVYYENEQYASDDEPSEIDTEEMYEAYNDEELESESNSESDCE